MFEEIMQEIKEQDKGGDLKQVIDENDMLFEKNGPELFKP
jgi:hypothetical protein